MTHRLHALFFASAMALPVIITAEQSGDAKTLNGSVTVTTSDNGRTVAVLGKQAGKDEGEFLFCMDLAQPALQKIAFQGPARVIYRPQPISGIPAGVKVSGPESVSSTLAVVPNAGRAWLFIARGEAALLPAGDPSRAGATTVNSRVVRRVDWVGDDGRRRGTDLAGCLAPAG